MPKAPHSIPDGTIILSYPKEMIKCVFDIRSMTKVRRETFIDSMRPFMPYCLTKINDSTFLPLNRDYKPIGCLGGNWYDYEKFECLFLDVNDIDLTCLWDNGVSFGRHSYFLYSDSCTPCRDLPRYYDILAHSIYKSNTGKDFNDYWEGKFSLDKDGWERNRAR